MLGVRGWRELVTDMKKMKGHCSTGQSPLQAVESMKEEKEEEEEEEKMMMMKKEKEKKEKEKNEKEEKKLQTNKSINI